MINNDEEHKEEVMANIFAVFKQDLLPINHIWFLEKLCSTFNCKPAVIYDIGSCVLHWRRHAHRIWPDADIICFDAFSPLEELYKQENIKYEIACLSDYDDMRLKFYQNDLLYGGNSVYRENTQFFDPKNFIIKETRSLDSLVMDRNYAYPDILKIDSQGSELDIIKGAKKCLEHATYLICELQDVDYNINAPKSQEVIEYLKSINYICIAPKFSSNPSDADYAFINKNKLVK